MIELPSNLDTELLPGETYVLHVFAPDAVLNRILTKPNWKATLEQYIAEHPDTNGRIDVLGSGVQHNNSEGERVYAIKFRALGDGGGGGGDSGGRISVSPAWVVPVVAALGVVIAGLVALGILEAANERYRLYLVEQGYDVPNDEPGWSQALPILGVAAVLFGVGYVLKGVGVLK